VGLAPLPDLIWVTPGRHQVTAKHASAAPAIEEADVTAGSVSTVTMRLHPVAVSVATINQTLDGKMATELSREFGASTCRKSPTFMARNSDFGISSTRQFSSVQG